jgi:hypothetical protein
VRRRWIQLAIALGLLAALSGCPAPVQVDEAPADNGPGLAPSTRKPVPTPSPGPTPKPLPAVIAQMQLIEPWLHAAGADQIESTFYFFKRKLDGELFFDGLRIKVDYALYTAVSGAKGTLLAKGTATMTGDSQRFTLKLAAPLGEASELYAVLTAHLPDGRDLKAQGVFPLE